MENKRPRSREQNNTGKGKGIFKRGATGNGPVGSGNVFDEIKDAAKENLRNDIHDAKDMVRGQGNQASGQAQDFAQQLQQLLQQQQQIEQQMQAQQAQQMQQHAYQQT